MSFLPPSFTVTSVAEVYIGTCKHAERHLAVRLGSFRLLERTDIDTVLHRPPYPGMTTKLLYISHIMVCMGSVDLRGRHHFSLQCTS